MSYIHSIKHPKNSNDKAGKTMLFLLLNFACNKPIDLTSLALIDVNPTSQTYEQEIELIDYEGKVSAWYFGHAT